MDHQRRNSDRAQHTRDLDLLVHPHQGYGGGGRGPNPLVPSPPPLELGIVGLGGSVLAQTFSRPPLPPDVLIERSELLLCRIPTGEPRKCSVEDQRGTAV